jgi:hypothetical protein
MQCTVLACRIPLPDVNRNRLSAMSNSLLLVVKKGRKEFFGVVLGERFLRINLLGKK